MPSALVAPLPGEVGRIDNVPVIVSDCVREGLNATGVYDGVTTSRSLALTVNRSGFVVGQRRAVTITTSDELLAEADQRAIMATLRLAFAATQPAGSEVLALTFDLATT